MESKEIQALRQSLGENTEKFGKRFARSARSVEDWEQGRRKPDPLIERLLERLRDRIERSK